MSSVDLLVLNQGIRPLGGVESFCFVQKVSEESLFCIFKNKQTEKEELGGGEEARGRGEEPSTKACALFRTQCNNPIVPMYTLTKE